MSRIDIDAGPHDARRVDAVLAARAAAFAAPVAEDRGAAAIAHLLFTIGTARHAVPVTEVEAVDALPPVTPVPGAPAMLAGLVPWRGGVVNLIDASVATGGAAGNGQAMILLRGDRPRVALRVDAVPGIAHLPPAANDANADLIDTPDGHVVRHAGGALVRAALAQSRYQEG